FNITTKETRRVYIVPDDGPDIEFIPNKDDTARKKHEVEIKVTETKHSIDDSSLKYMWAYEKWRLPYKKTLEDVIRTSFTNNEKVSKSTGTGLYRLYAIAKDIYGNTTIETSGFYRLDNSKPAIYLNGRNPQRVLIETEYKEYGARAYDKYFSGDI